MIRGFRDKDTEALYQGRYVRRFQGFRAQSERRLDRLDNATHLSDLAQFSGNRLEALSGNRKGQYSIRINDQWRICFKWHEDGPYNVEITDYH